MSDIIKLPAGTKKIPVYEIASLLACAKGTTSLLINLEKQVTSSEQTLPLNDKDINRLVKIWKIKADLHALFRITKEEWVKREVTFNNTKGKPNWSLVPIWEEFPNPVTERKIQQQLEHDISNVKSATRLIIRDPVTNAPTTIVRYAYVTVEEFIRYASTVYLIEVQLESEPASKSKVTTKTEKNNVLTNKLNRNHLDPAIDEAVKLAGNMDLAEVYIKIKEMALNGYNPFTGVIDGDALCYTNDSNQPDKLTKSALGKRLRIRKKREV